MQSRIGNFFSKITQPLVYALVVGGIALAVWQIHQYRNRATALSEAEPKTQSTLAAVPKSEKKLVKLTAQARQNLGIKVNTLRPETYYRKQHIPGIVVDRIGESDRGINSPIEGVVERILKVEGDVVQPGERLFTIRIVSESLRETELDLFKAVQESAILNTKTERYKKLLQSRAIAAEEVRELKREAIRQSALISGFEQHLYSRGLNADQVNQIRSGNFLKRIEVSVPALASLTTDSQPFLEIQQLNVKPGDQVVAGQALGVLADHQSLYVEGHAFKKEIGKLAALAEKRVEVELEFEEDLSDEWPPLSQKFFIRHLANSGKEDERTFDFFIPVKNQSRMYQQDGDQFINWRFRSGQRVRIKVPIEKLENVLVLPAEGVTFQGPEAFVFQQNGDLFNRLSVKVVYQDRDHVIIANDNSIAAGTYIAHNAAASLNRILESQAASGQRNDLHVHADGTVHGAH